MLRKSAGKCHLYAGVSAIGVLSSVALASPTLAAIATFDNFSEGFSGTTITDEGITFFDLDERLGQSPAKFSLEGSTAEQLGSAAPNYLTTEGFVPGPDPSFGRFGSARITTGKVQQAASLELFSQPAPSNNILTLEARREGNLVNSDSAALNDFESVGTGSLFHKTFAVSGVAFDELQLVASGPDQQGVAFIGIDNVRTVPEPSSGLGILAVGALGWSLLTPKQKRVS